MHGKTFKPLKALSPLALSPLALALALLAAQPAQAVMLTQCPGINGAANPNEDLAQPAAGDGSKSCMHLLASDGWARMGDGVELYTFGFYDHTGSPTATAVDSGTLAAQMPAPTIALTEGMDFYLTLSNIGFQLRPDLFDPHTVHFHGFPQAAPVFDGMPEGSFGVNMNASQTFYYRLRDPGTYLYHCHMEATEHMQMGMMGSLYVKPKQDGSDVLVGGKTYSQFAYNDLQGNAATHGISAYDVAYPLQFNSFDRDFHEMHVAVQALPFATLHTDYAFINGRGYPDTVDEGYNFTPVDTPNQTVNAQPMSSRVTAVQGQRVLLRLSNLSITDYMTVISPSIDMQVVGMGAAIARGPSDVDAANPIYPVGSKSMPTDRFYGTNSVTMGGGEAYDVILDTGSVAPGTYFLYTANLNFLSNHGEDYGGAMTEIVITDPNQQLAQN